MRGTAGLLVDREAALAAGAEALAAATAARGGVLAVTGPAGIGKTAVLAAVAQHATDAGALVLRARASHVEREFPFGVVRQLTARVVHPDTRPEGVLRGVPATARAAIGVGGADHGEHVQDALPTVLHGLHWLVTNLALSRPVLLVVDDVQWSDAASLAFLEYLARRVADQPVLVVLGLRTPEAGAEQAEEAVLRLVDAGDAQQVQLRGLGSRAVRLLAEHRLGAPADEEFVRACQDTTGGNPFLVCAQLDELARRGSTPSRTAAASLHTSVPDAVCRDVLVRLSRLPAECRSVAEAVAVLGGNAEVRLAAAVAELPVTTTEEVADALAAAGLLTEGRPLDVVHPLVRQAVYDDIPAGRRSRLHRSAAQALSVEGAPAARQAAHLLKVEPGTAPWAPPVLRKAAAEAAAAGLADVAVQHLERALVEAPAGDRGELLIELGLAQAHAALLACTDTLAAALDEGVAAERRAEVSLELARALWYLAGDSTGALQVLDEVDVAALDGDTALRIASQRIELRTGWVDGLGGLGPEARERAAAELPVLLPAARPPRPASAVLLGTLARRALEQGEPTGTAAALAHEAIEAGPESLLYSSGPDVLIWAEDYDGAARVLAALLDDARRSGSPYGFGVGSLWRGALAYRLGRLDDAEADCRACVDVMAGLGVEGLTFPAAFLADAVLERDLDEAEAVLARVRPAPGAEPSEFYLHSRGRLRAAQGRLEEAVADLTAAGARATSPTILPWRSSLANVLVQAGEPADALRLAQEEVALTEHQGGSRARAVAWHAVGRASGPVDGVPALEAALEALQGSPATLVRAAVLADLGRFHRLGRRVPEAREALRSALDAASACGARRLADEVRAELVASGARPRRAATTGTAALTASEHRVAELAAAGKSNRDIAHALFVSPWTVASHLTRVYAKLDVAGRDQLAGALAQGRVSGP